jgi:FixJ family two-component response regulator
MYMSGYTGEAVTRRKLLGSGAAFLQKPFNGTQLAQAVRRVLADSHVEPV